MKRKKTGNQWYIVTTHAIVERKYLVEATSAREARRECDWSNGLLGANDEDEDVKIVRTKGFKTKEEAEESDEAYVEWKN